MSEHAKQAELIEHAELKDLHDAATPEVRQELGLQLVERGNVLASIAGGLPASAIVVNRAIGLGMGEPATAEDVQDVVGRYHQAGAARFFIQRHPDARPAELNDWLLEAGLEKARGWQKFERGMEPGPGIDTHLEIRRIGPEHGEAFARIACDAFDLGEAAVPWIAALPGRDRWHVFMSFENGEPVGTGALFVDDGCGWTDFGATSPKFRQRGSQAALLAARIDYARQIGCRALYTCTGEEVPGDPQHSYSNILKAGFRETYIKENYAPPKQR